MSGSSPALSFVAYSMMVRVGRLPERAAGPAMTDLFAEGLLIGGG
jgi:hypothetical protein